MIKPTGHRILVDVDEADLEVEFATGAFTIVSDKKLEDAHQIIGTLVDIGPQAWKAFGPDFSGEPWAKLGDRIMFAEYAGRTVEDPETGKKYKLMNDEDVTAVVTGEKDVS